jgi:hypothetical protein
MKNRLLILICLGLNSIFAQTNYCPDDPPVNPWLAESPWPVYHRNNYAQSSTCLKGPVTADSLVVKSKINIQGGTSPWMYISEPYPNGKRAMYYSNATFVYKFVDDGTSIVTADSLRIDFDLVDFGWNFLLSKNKTWFTYDPKSSLSSNNTTALFRLTDANINNIYSRIVVKDTFLFEDYGLGNIQTFGLNYSGQIVFNSENDVQKGYATVGIIDQNFNLLDTLNYSCSANEIVHHNAMAIDEFNNFYIVTTKRMICFAWDGTQLTKAWESWYDFVNDGPTGSFAEGSGTTPTLIGWGNGNDKLVVVVDGHAKNNLVAFWRELPPDWTSIPGMDIRFADKIKLPLATQLNNTFQSVENSPCAFGYDIGIAQFNGFLGYPCNNTKGVQKIHWDTISNKFSVVWLNNSININGVLTYSQGSNLVYGSGKESDCNYYFYGLDWDSGAIKLRKLLGPSSNEFNDPFYDAGNNNIIDETGSVYFPGGKSLIKLEKINIPSNVEHSSDLLKENIRIYPNPTHDMLQIEFININIDIERVELYNLIGQRVYLGVQNQLSMEHLNSSIYLLKIDTNKGNFSTKVIKQ